MTCDPSNRRITVEVPNAGLEIAPHTVDFRRERGKFDYFDANFHNDVGNHIQDEVINDGGSLAYQQKAYVKMEGERVYPMAWEPGLVGFGRDLTSVELLDPIHDLENAYVDIRREAGSGQDILREIFEDYKSQVEDPMLNVLLFPQGIDPDNTYVTESGINVSGEPSRTPKRGLRSLPDAVGGFINKTRVGFEWTADVVTDVFYKDYAIDYDEITAFEAFMDMIDRMGVDIWTKPQSPGSMQYQLCAGKFWSRQQVHDASPDNPNFFKITDFNVRTMDSPIKTVVVRGRMMHDDDVFSFENIKEAVNSKKKTQDYRAHGVATRDIPRGRKVTIDSDAPIDSLAGIAETKMAEYLQVGTSGELSISPANSGKVASDYRNLSVGDIILTREPESEKCKEDSQIFENHFIITGVENNISNGAWSINLDVVDKVRNDEIPKGQFRLFDVNDESYVDPEDLADRGLAEKLAETSAFELLP